jgi:hypothetical protein
MNLEEIDTIELANADPFAVAGAIAAAAASPLLPASPLHPKKTPVHP